MRDNLLDDYFIRKEWINCINQSISDSFSFKKFLDVVYRVIRIKNQLIKFCISYKTNKGIAIELLEAEYDYSCIELYTLISNEFTCAIHDLGTKLNSAVIEQLKNKIIFDKKERKK